jgi:glycosyltransferase involved in cell wall biosynthesis
MHKSYSKNGVLSIISINFNNLNGLKQTIESVINQSWKEYEYIIIDGASTDGSAEYLTEMQSHFTYWVSEPDKGIYNAMNKGIKVAKGEYLLFLNSGDFFVNDQVLNNLNQYLVTEKFDLYFFSVQRHWGIREIFPFTDFKMRLLSGQNVPHQASFIKKSLFNKFGCYNENYKICGDVEFFCRLLSKDVSSSIERLVITQMQPDGIGNSMTFRHQIELIHINLKYLRNFKLLKKELKTLIHFLLSK